MNMCVNDVFEWQSHPNAAEMMGKKACTAVAAYMEEAKLRGIWLKVRRMMKRKKTMMIAQRNLDKGEG